MIDDSIPWKDDLLRIADSLERRRSQKRWSGRTSFLIERDVMVGAYAVRKLNEARKVSDELLAEGLRARRHRLVGPVPDVWTRYEFWELFDMESGEDVTLSIPAFCNQVIHSWIWIPSVAEESNLFDGVFVSSDWSRRKHLHFISAAELVTVFRSVGSDEINYLEMRAGPTGERTFVRALRVPPDDGELV